jgi:hypothetical protein
MADPRANTGRTRRLSLYFIIPWIIARFGLEANAIKFVGGRNKGKLYLEQFLLHLLLITLRLHCFRMGDDDRAPHDHPFWFWTFPLCGYYERYWDPAKRIFKTRWVAPFRFHFRPAKFRHCVKIDTTQVQPDGVKFCKSPVWTIVICGRYTNRWGFWPTPSKFVPATAWEAYCREHNL